MKGGRPSKKPVEQERQVSTLEESGISRDVASRAQRMAAVPEDKFEAAIATVRQEEQQITHRAFVSLIGEAPSFNHRAQGTGENEWYTPPEYIEKARRAFGGYSRTQDETTIKNTGGVQVSRYPSARRMWRQWG